MLKHSSPVLLALLIQIPATLPCHTFFLSFYLPVCLSVVCLLSVFPLDSSSSVLSFVCLPVVLSVHGFMTACWLG